jgi:hypothetical protein
MKLLILLLLSLGCLSAQSVTDVMNAVKLASASSSTLLTLTASQGDGGTLKITKNNGAAISATVSWSSADGKIAEQSAVLKASGTATLAKFLSFGDVACLLGVNPTVAAVTIGSVGSVPTNGIGWSCSTNITSTGMQTTPVSGTAVWP